jgi:hypothetical protein
VLLDEKICFIRLPPDTLQNVWLVITLEKMTGRKVEGEFERGKIIDYIIGESRPITGKSRAV